MTEADLRSCIHESGGRLQCDTVMSRFAPDAIARELQESEAGAETGFVGEGDGALGIPARQLARQHKVLLGSGQQAAHHRLIGPSATERAGGAQLLKRAEAHAWHPREE
jgi:hypothetical protein